MNRAPERPAVPASPRKARDGGVACAAIVHGAFEPPATNAAIVRVSGSPMAHGFRFCRLESRDGALRSLAQAFPAGYHQLLGHGDGGLFCMGDLQ